MLDDPQLEAFDDNPLYASALRSFEREVGVKLTDVVRLFGGEIAFYAAPGSPIPELTLLRKKNQGTSPA